MVDYDWDGVDDILIYFMGLFNCIVVFEVFFLIVSDNCLDWMIIIEILVDGEMFILIIDYGVS